MNLPTVEEFAAACQAAGTTGGALRFAMSWIYRLWMGRLSKKEKQLLAACADRGSFQFVEYEGGMAIATNGHSIDPDDRLTQLEYLESMMRICNRGMATVSAPDANGHRIFHLTAAALRKARNLAHKGWEPPEPDAV